MIGLADFSISGTSLLAVRRRLESRAKSHWFPFHFCIPPVLHITVLITFLSFLSTLPSCFLTLAIFMSFFPFFSPLLFRARKLTTVLLTFTDDKVLIEMGSVREGQTETEKEQYRAGLKEIINEMRRDKVKDFSTVASEIVAYRRRFLQDPTRVLPL